MLILGTGLALASVSAVVTGLVVAVFLLGTGAALVYALASALVLAVVAYKRMG